MHEIDERHVFVGKDGVFIGENHHVSVIITLSACLLQNQIKFCFELTCNLVKQIIRTQRALPERLGRYHPLF